MTYNLIFYVIIAILVIDFALERFLEYLNRKRMTSDLPQELKDVFDAEQYKKQQAYKKTNDRFGTLTSSFSFIILLLMLFLGGFKLVDSWARGVTENPVFIVLVFFGILAIASDLITTPFSLYDIFVIEERFGFNRTTPKTYVLDKIKGWLLGAVIGGGLLALIVWFYSKTGTDFWIYAWILAVVFTVFMAMFYSSLIVPLFNKQKPLPDGELRDAIQAFSVKAGFKLNNIFVIDGSKRSSKANAYFTGLGPKKRIVLYDTLIKDLTTEEIVAVLAHEIGHYKKHHVYAGLLAGIIQTGFTLYILSLLIANPALSEALGGSQPAFHLGLIAFGILYSPISLVTGLLMNHISRRNEYAADNFVKMNSNPEALVNALKKLSSKNLSNLTPHPAYVFFHYSHPTLLQRVKALKSKAD
ncbi:MAG TPA: M48 family metallopeptidase [Bacteroidales bacterium]|nr:M48 family metallopeptidase [Bacteroidales bacterium]